uniref:Inversin n=1 Tax=Vombatus ursinus TaxID=29139 RepID=A0A4X2JZB6_VOMUR
MNTSESWVLSGSSLASQVHAAAVNGDKGALQKLMAGDRDLKDKEDQFGRTPLMYCVLADRVDCADALLKAGADVNKADHSQRTALHLAAQKGNYRFMKLLLTRRANWMQKDLEEMTPLHLTTRHKSPKCLALLLKFMAPGEVDTQDKNKQTALHWSAYYNNPEHVKLLIKHDSNIGIPDIEGKIPLHWAANHKDPSAVHTVRCILDAAPTESLLNWQDYEGRTPLHFAVADGNVTVVDVLTSYESCNITSYDNLFRTPLHWAALLGHAQIVHLLLERNKLGTIPSDSQGATPLHYASQSNFAETVEVFLKHPSVKDDSDLEGRTSFMWAAGKGSDDVLRTMLSLKLDIDINMTDKYGGTGGARVDLVDQDGHSLLHWAALGGNADVCQILIENKINPNVQDYAGRTPLQCAAYGGYINCMALLMENNADPNIQDKEGRTALHWSCNNGYLDAIKLLLSFAAFPNQMENNEERYTPLDYALLGEHHEVIQFMLEHGALSIAAIQDIAAFKIQAVYKGYKVRKAFQDRKNLLMKHEQLRKDAAAKKREEESKRKEGEHQKGTLNHMKGRTQAQKLPEKRTPATRPPQPPSKPTIIPGKPPFSSNASPSRMGKNRGSPGVSPDIANRKEQFPSTEKQGENHQRQKESTREHSKGKVPSVHFGPNERDNEHKPQVAISKSEGEKSQESPSLRGKGVPRHASSSKARGAGEKLEDRTRTVACSGEPLDRIAAMSLPNSNCPVGNLRHRKHRETVSRTKVYSMKRQSKELKGERCSPAGSSRPGSAKAEPSYPGNEASCHRGQRSRGADNEVVGRVCSGLPSKTGLARPGPNNTGMHPMPGDRLNSVKTKTANAGDRLSSPVGQNFNIELLPLESRLMIIEKERTRKELFRKKNHAAAVIQRAWRSYQLRKKLSELCSARRRGEEGEDKWRQERATFLFQVAWKKQLNPKALKPVSSCKTTKSTSKSNSLIKQNKQTVLQQIYGCSQEGKVHHSMRPSSKPPLSAMHLISGKSEPCGQAVTGHLSGVAAPG